MENVERELLKGFETQDETFMAKAFREARKGYGRTSPNPMVGCVVVRNDEIISSGFHEYFGGPHAEVNALKDLSSEDLSEATVYVTLEPCCHTNKKTPPCLNLLLEKKPKKVVIANIDPNPEVAGKSVQALMDSGIEVKVGVLEHIGQELNEVFFFWKKKKRPFVHVKYAQTIDGKIASVTGDSKWISDDVARKEVHDLRLRYDAILVGKNTANLDNPRLNIRYGFEEIKECPYRIIIGNLEGMKKSLNLFNDEFADKTIVISPSSEANQKTLPYFAKKGVQVVFVEGGKRISPKQILEELNKLGISSVLVEGGASILSQFLTSGLVNKVTAYIAPKIIGAGKNMFEFDGINTMDNAFRFKNPTFRTIENQVVMQAEGLIS